MPRLSRRQRQMQSDDRLAQGLSAHPLITSSVRKAVTPAHIAKVTELKVAAMPRLSRRQRQMQSDARLAQGLPSHPLITSSVRKAVTPAHIAKVTKPKVFARSRPPSRRQRQMQSDARLAQGLPSHLPINK